MKKTNQRKKYIWMIILGFAAPFVLIILATILSAGVNLMLTSSNSLAGGGTANIINVFVLLLGLLGVTAFIWGPVIGIIGIVKLANLKGK